MILIKINKVPGRSSEELKERVRKTWRINYNRLYNQDTVIATYKGEILEVYEILSYSKDINRENRVIFELEKIESDLKGKKIITKTSNPCTIIEQLEFK